mmetsp:Transcript_39528/g.101477  ORF Transcript_39528/g.101477 Transcript_39528/m.101477 type:complete len:640 (-) Transcript_39528:94-2013(-)
MEKELQDDLAENEVETPIFVSPKIMSFMSRRSDALLQRRSFAAWLTFAKEAALSRQQKAISSRLEKIRALEDDVLAGRIVMSSHMKKRQVTQAFQWFGMITVLCLFSLVLYYDYLLVEQCWTAVVWAVVCSAILAKPKKKGIRLVEKLDKVCEPYKAILVVGLIAIAIAPSASLFVEAVSKPFVLFSWRVYLSAGLLYAVWMIAYSNRNSFVTILLVLLSFAIIFLPLGITIKNLLLEAKTATKQIVDFLSDNVAIDGADGMSGSAALSKLVNESTALCSTVLMQVSSSFGQQIGILPDEVSNSCKQFVTVDGLRSVLLQGSDWMSHNVDVFLLTTLNFVSNIGTITVQFTVFCTCFFYFLLESEHIFGYLSNLSPFSDDDSEKLGKSIRRSLLRIAVGAVGIFIIHSCSTFASLTASGFLVDVRLLLSISSGFLAVLPLTSPLVIFLPGAAFMFYQGSSWLRIGTLLGPQLVLLYYIHPIIYSKMASISSDADEVGSAEGSPQKQTHAQSRFSPSSAGALIGLSVALGLAAYGLQGALLGPLLAGVSITIIDIYVAHQWMSFDENFFSPAGSKAKSATSQAQQARDERARQSVLESRAGREKLFSSVKKARREEANDRICSLTPTQKDALRVQRKLQL